jgi:hypothetical protein
MAADRPPRTDLLPPWAASDTAARVYGPRGIGKSFLALGIAWLRRRAAASLAGTAAAGAAIDPIEARLAIGTNGLAHWSWTKAETHEVDRVAALLRQDLNPNQIASELGISKSKAYRLREQMANLPPARF